MFVHGDVGIEIIVDLIQFFDIKIDYPNNVDTIPTATQVIKAIDAINEKFHQDYVLKGKVNEVCNRKKGMKVNPVYLLIWNDSQKNRGVVPIMRAQADIKTPMKLQCGAFFSVTYGHVGEYDDPAKNRNCIDNKLGKSRMTTTGTYIAERSMDTGMSPHYKEECVFKVAKQHFEKALETQSTEVQEKGKAVINAITTLQSKKPQIKFELTQHFRTCTLVLTDPCYKNTKSLRKLVQEVKGQPSALWQAVGIALMVFGAGIALLGGAMNLTGAGMIATGVLALPGGLSVGVGSGLAYGGLGIFSAGLGIFSCARAFTREGAKEDHKELSDFKDEVIRQGYKKGA